MRERNVVLASLAVMLVLGFGVGVIMYFAFHML